ncbi:MAG: thiol:disulfide interchange protein DsbA/DsbL [Pseudomonadales bacterium]|nr:thiol:disulfide interchange protein DsbA/DsbL [Pseudomonadales bacterium]
MKRLTLILAGVLMTLTAAVSAQDVPYEEGTHYVALEVPIKTRNEGRIEVAEYFSYGCPHCFSFDPLIGAWKEKLADDVEFIRTPAVWNKDYEVYAQTYYAAQALDVLDTIHTPLFEAIHLKQERLNDPRAMARFFGEHGVDPADFAKAYSSFGVRAGTQQAVARGRAYRSGGVPAIIVNGKYRVEGSMAGSMANVLKVVDFLIEKERAALQSQ